MLRETARARQAWADYLALGPDRSLAKLQALYAQRVRSAGKAGVPTRHLSRLERWSTLFGWQQRIQDFTEQQVREATAAAAAAEAARIREIMETGVALTHERVDVLKEMVGHLLEDLRDPEKRWLKDVKGIGWGDKWAQVDIERFNAAELEQLRGLLDDIAKETGGRPKVVRIDLEAKIRVMAREMGLDEEAAVVEAQRILEAGSGTH